jgi:hypothetical protein
MAHSTERLMSFSQEMAGKRVGWVSVGRLNDVDHDHAPLSVQVTSATVGAEGAWFGHLNVEGRDRIGRVPIAVQEGFYAVAAMSAVLTPGAGNGTGDEANFAYGHESRQGSSRADLLRVGVGLRQQGQTDPVLEWAKSRSELIDVLKGKLGDEGFDDRYAQLYYWLNGSIARFGIDKRNPFEGMRLDELLMPDPGMEAMTREQSIHAHAIAETLGHAADHDEKMRQRLTVFSDIPAETVPTRFIDNRTYVASGESTVAEHVSRLAVSRLVYLPVGSRRTWPYMDASEADGLKAFGLELDGLRKKSIEPADTQLRKEAEELRARQQFAADGAQRFDAIAQAEAA